MSYQNIDPNKKQAFTSLLFGGLLPVIAFTLVEEYYGPLYGVIAAMVFGVGEISYELWKYKKVQKITWISNALILAMGAIAIIADDGLWFKMQPAIMELFFAVVLIGSYFLKKPLLLMMSEKQHQPIPPHLKNALPGLTFRIGVFFVFQAALATWAALYWSTAAWAFLKSVGIILFLIVYMLGEGLYLRKKFRELS